LRAFGAPGPVGTTGAGAGALQGPGQGARRGAPGVAERGGNTDNGNMVPTTPAATPRSSDVRRP